jgi:hypothetical protein
MADHFAELARIEDVAVLRARLEVLAGRDLRQPAAELETGLRKLGLEPVRAVLVMKTLQLPAVAATAATGAGLPIAAGQSDLVAAQFVASNPASRLISQPSNAAAARQAIYRDFTGNSALAVSSTGTAAHSAAPPLRQAIHEQSREAPPSHLAQRPDHPRRPAAPSG